MVRVRLDDLIAPWPAPCPCGSPRLAVAPIEGRVGDLWRFGNRVICPRDVELAMDAALGPHAQWMATAAPDRVVVATDSPALETAAEAVHALVPAGVAVETTTFNAASLWPKRRRVRWNA